MLMRYALLICHDETKTTGTDPARLAAFDAFQGELDGRGVPWTAVRLRPTSAATTVRVRDNELVIADGPFAETKEQIAGFYLVECQDLDAAIEFASKIPAAQWGTIEVRPVWDA
jgi:hypothetical protein